MAVNKHRIVQVDRKNFKERLRVMPNGPELLEEAYQRRLTAGKQSRPKCYADAMEETLPKLLAWEALNLDKLMIKVGDANTLDRLRRMMGDVPENRECPRKAAMTWVADRIHGGLTISPTEIPSRQALGMLIWCLESDDNRKQFVLKIWEKQQDSTEEDKYADDHRRIDALIEAALEWHRAAVLDTRSEGLPLELAIPEDDPEFWTRPAA